MKIAFNRDAAGEAVGLDTQAMSLDLRKQAKLYAMLSDGLYKNKLMSIIREIMSNAWDAHVMADRRTHPIDLHVPTLEQPWLAIRDYGPGLTPDEAYNTIFCYLGSAKDDSDDYIGGWGVGAKSPFSYADAYEVVIYRDGRRYEYACWKDEAGLPNHALFDQSATDEPNGVSVKVEIQPGDVYACTEHLRDYLYYTQYPVRLLNVSGDEAEEFPRHQALFQVPVETTRGGRMAAIIADRNSTPSIYVYYGGFVYDIADIEWDADNDRYLDDWRNTLRDGYSVILHAHVGDCKFAVSRESITGVPQTFEWVMSALRSLQQTISTRSQRYAEQYIRPICDRIYDPQTQCIRANLTAAEIMAAQRDYCEHHEGNASVFSYINFGKWAQSMTPPEFRQDYCRNLRVSGDLYSIMCPLKVDETPYPAKIGRRTVNLRDRVRRLEIRRRRRNYSSYYYVSPLVVRELVLDVLTDVRHQIEFLWSPDAYTSKHYGQSTADVRNQSRLCIMLQAGSQADAEALVAHLGFAGVAVLPAQSAEKHFPFTPEKTSARSAATGTARTEYPRVLQDYYTNYRRNYLQSGSYYYWDSQSPECRHGLEVADGVYVERRVVEYYYSQTQDETFTASPTFLRRYRTTMPPNIRPIDRAGFWQRVDPAALLVQCHQYEYAQSLEQYRSLLENCLPRYHAAVGQCVRRYLGVRAAAAATTATAGLSPTTYRLHRTLLQTLGQWQDAPATHAGPTDAEVQRVMRVLRNNVWLRTVQWDHYASLPREDRLYVMARTLKSLEADLNTMEPQA